MILNRAGFLFLGLMLSLTLKNQSASGQDAKLEAILNNWGASYQLFDASVGEVQFDVPGQEEIQMKPKTYAVRLRRSGDQKEMMLMIPAIMAHDGANYHVAVVHGVGPFSESAAENAKVILTHHVAEESTTVQSPEGEHFVAVPTKICASNTQDLRNCIERDSMKCEQGVLITQMIAAESDSELFKLQSKLAEVTSLVNAEPNVAMQASTPANSMADSGAYSHVSQSDQSSTMTEDQLLQEIEELLGITEGSASYVEPVSQPTVATTYTSPSYSSVDLTAPLQAPAQPSVNTTYSAPTYSTIDPTAPLQAPSEPSSTYAYQSPSQNTLLASGATDPATRRSLLEFERKKCLDQLLILNRMYLDHDYNFRENIYINGVVSGSSVAGSASALRQKLLTEARLREIDEELSTLQWNR